MSKFCYWVFEIGPKSSRKLWNSEEKYRNLYIAKIDIRYLSTVFLFLDSRTKSSRYQESSANGRIQWDFVNISKKIVSFLRNRQEIFAVNKKSTNTVLFIPAYRQQHDIVGEKRKNTISVSASYDIRDFLWFWLHTEVSNISLRFLKNQFFFLRNTWEIIGTVGKSTG